MLGGGAGGGRPENIIAGIEDRARTVARFGFIGGIGGVIAGGEDESSDISWIAAGVTGAVAFAGAGLEPPKLTLDARAGTALWKKSFEGVAPAKYELTVATGGEGRVVMLVRLCERNGAGSERICMLVGRRRAPACWAPCCDGPDEEELIAKGSDGILGR
jgi:hypothetical protein